ncbi:MAG: DUF1295 domain-containing protein [Candidatus Komeilibacteria bacterium]
MLLDLLFFSLLIQAVLFVAAFIKQTDKLTDFSYGLTFVILAITGLFQSSKLVGHYILTAMIVLWALRLAVYLVIRIRKIKKDKRFDGIREKFLSFAGFWLLQGITIWVVLISSIFYYQEAVEFNSLSIIGMAIYLFGLYFESLADMQKYRHINNPNNKDRWIQTGLWKYSRHPNYFGEICVWLGVYLFVFPTLHFPLSLIALLSPLYITILLLFVSGIPKLEKYADNRWGNDQEYLKYKESTSILIPWFNKK